MEERVWFAQPSVWQAPHIENPAVLPAEENLFLLLSIATRPNSCKINPGINRVSEAAFTSDCVVLCVRGSQTVIYKPFQVLCLCDVAAVVAAIESQFIQQWIFTKWKAWSAQAAWWGCTSLQEASWKEQSVLWIRAGLGLSSKLCPNTDYRMKRFPLLILCSCCYCWQWYLSLPGMTKSSKRKFGQSYFWSQIQNGGSREEWKINGKSLWISTKHPSSHTSHIKAVFKILFL